MSDQIKCDQADCHEDATRWYVWPGKSNRMYACLPHAIKAAGVMGALGYPLQLYALSTSSPGATSGPGSE